MVGKWTRRSVGRMLVGVPVALASTAWLGSLRDTGAADPAAEEPPPAEPEPTPLAKFLARQENGLSKDERAKVRKNVTQLEQGLQKIRDFKMPNDVPPAGTFFALKSKRA